MKKPTFEEFMVQHEGLNWRENLAPDDWDDLWLESWQDRYYDEVESNEEYGH